MKKKNENHDLNSLRHSAAHLLAAAIMELWPDTKLTIGPAIENGFYYDLEFSKDAVLSEKDFPQIEKKMHELVQDWNGFERIEVSEKEARKRFKNNPYKLELIDEIVKRGEPLTLYKSGDFTDLCRGGHDMSPKDDLKHFKLMKLAGAYWRGDEKNKMLTRVYGTAFFTKEELDNYLNMLEEAEKRDHRKLGKELDLFVFSELVGAGLPLFTPKGTILRDELFAFSESLQKRYGYQKVWIPHITKNDLYKVSGHWDKFGDELFLVKSQETDDQFVMKPMNCPHHIQIYASRPRSYRDLPIRYMETTTQYRDEKKGEMLGLSRVRSITIDDAHIFVRPDQVEQEFENIMNMIKEMYGTLGMEFKARLSFRNDEDKYLGDKKDWEMAQKTIEDIAKKLGVNYVVAEGEAAFYGPKIDIMVVDALGREWQCATEQLDFVQPVRFDVTYTDEHGDKKHPFMIHKALLGSIERFLSVYIEHTLGNFPIWLSPLQVRVIPIADRHLDFAEELVSMLREHGVRVDIDNNTKNMNKKIRDAQIEKINYMVVIGDKEVKSNLLTIRKRSGENLEEVPIKDFIELVEGQIKNKELE